MAYNLKSILHICTTTIASNKFFKRSSALINNLAQNILEIIKFILKQKRPPLWSSGQSSWLQIRRPVFDSRHYKKKVVGLERGPLSLMSTTEELLGRKVALITEISPFNPMHNNVVMLQVCYFDTNEMTMVSRMLSHYALETYT
jgi:hypothetical protein